MFLKKLNKKSKREYFIITFIISFYKNLLKCKPLVFIRVLEKYLLFRNKKNTNKGIRYVKFCNL